MLKKRTQPLYTHPICVYTLAYHRTHATCARCNSMMATQPPVPGRQFPMRIHMVMNVLEILEACPLYLQLLTLQRQGLVELIEVPTEELANDRYGTWLDGAAHVVIRPKATIMHKNALRDVAPNCCVYVFGMGAENITRHARDDIQIIRPDADNADAVADLAVQLASLSLRDITGASDAITQGRTELDHLKHSSIGLEDCNWGCFGLGRQAAWLPEFLVGRFARQITFYLPLMSKAKFDAFLQDSCRMCGAAQLESIQIEADVFRFDISLPLLRTTRNLT